MKAEMNLENMKLLGILEMVERKLLETAYYHELGFGEIKTIFHNIRYDCGFEDTRTDDTDGWHD